jgi:hypothetical protein
MLLAFIASLSASGSPVISSACPVPIQAPTTAVQYTGTFVIQGSGFNGGDVTTDGPLGLVGAARVNLAGTVIEKDYTIGCCVPTIFEGATFHLFVVTSSGSATTQTSITLLTPSPPPCQLPSISAIANSSISQNTPGVFNFTVGDPVTALTSLILAGAPDNQSVVPNANIVFGGSGANRSVTVTPAVNASGIVNITLQVSNASGAFAQSRFQLTVGTVNQPPSISLIPNQTTSENRSIAVPFTVSDLETPANALAVTASSDNATLLPTAKLVLAGSGNNRTLTVTPGANTIGVGHVTVAVTAGGGLSSRTTFQMTVGPAFATDFNTFNPLAPPASTWLNGSATAYNDSSGGVNNSGVLKLTTATPSQISTFIIDDLNGGQPIGGFTATFKLLIGGGTPIPADGFSFNFAPDIGTSDLFAEEGEGSGLTVEFDTFDNGDEAPAMDIKWAGQLVARTWFAGSGPAGRQLFRDASGNPVSLETGGAFVPVTIQLNSNGALTVQFNGLTVYNNLYLPGYAPTHGRFALAARTGSSTDNHFVDDLSIVTIPVSSASASVLQSPQSQTVNAGDSVTFSVVPGGAAPFNFQWFRNGILITGATANQFTIPSVLASDTGATFTATVASASGSMTSAAATLTVRPAQLLFADSFNISTSSAGVNVAYDIGRQSGSLAPTHYDDDFANQAPPGSLLLNTPAAPGQLQIQTTRVSPNHNFVEANRFRIEFDLNVGIDDDAAPSGDYWAAIVLGTAQPNAYVQSPDGFGILFRNAGWLAVFDGPNFAMGEAPMVGLPTPLPLGQFHVRLDVTTTDFQNSPASIALFINGQQVQISNGTGKEYTKQSGFTGNFLTVLGSTDPNLTPRSHAFDNLTVTAFSLLPPPSDAANFYIEAEDFDYNGGQHKTEADRMPYYGGAYEGLGAVQGVDYFGGSPDPSDVYRSGENPNVGITGNIDSSRGSFTVTTGFKVGWNNVGDWYEYTRNFPSGTYNVYARLASGGSDEHAQLALVTSGAATPNQSIVSLGTFDAPATGGWDTFASVPLRTDSGDLAALRLGGAQTLRFTVLPGNLDYNYLALVPALPPSGASPNLISVFTLNGNQVMATFDRMLDPTSPSDPTHYTISGTTITSAVLESDAKTVVLTCSGATGSTVTLTVNGLVGASGVAVPAGMSLTGGPLPLVPIDIAAPGSGAAAGGFSPLDAQDFDITAGGNNIGGNEDGLHFDYQRWSGDFDALVQVTRLDASGAFALAGLMIRQNLTPGSPEASVGLNPWNGGNNNEYGLSRGSQDGPTTVWSYSNGTAGTTPWLRLKRLGNALLAYRSADGVNWTKLGQTTQVFSDPVLLGLATSPGNFTPGVTTVAHYRSYAVSSTPTPVLQIRATDAYASEAGADPGLFTISFLGDRSQPFTAQYSIGGTAVNGTDYVMIPSALTIPAGQISASVPINPIPDALLEGMETVTLTLSSVAGVDIEPASATVGLFDDQPQSGFLKRAIYQDIGFGIQVSDLTSSLQFPNSPSQADVVSSIESPTVAEGTLGNGYGQRLSGYLIPPSDGSYTFYVCSDDASELWLSADSNPAHKTLIASEPTWNPSREWVNALNQGARGNPAANVSGPIFLQGGSRYYIEVLHKQGTGGNDLAVAWQLPNQPPPANGSAPIDGAYLEVRVPLSIAMLSPAAVQSGGSDFVLSIQGAGFVNGATVNWNGSARTTTFINSKQLSASITAADIASTADILTATVTVLNPDGEVSNPLPFTIGSAAVASTDSSLVPPGGTAVVSNAPATQSDSGQAGVSATFSNTDTTSTASVTAATYSTNPNQGTLFDVGAGFVDLQVTGAQPSDSMSANFYYPSTVTGATENSLVLLFYDGTAWQPVLSRGGTAPLKDTTDNLDGTVTGGRFSVLFDSTSTPVITALSGTAFAPTTPTATNTRTPPVPDRASLPALSGECSVVIMHFPTATDAVSHSVTATTSDPLTYNKPGTYTVHWTYTDALGNIAQQNQSVVVTKQSPVPGAIVVPSVPVLLGSGISVQCPFTDTCDTHSALWNWGDGGAASGGTVNESNGSGTAFGTHTYAAAGIYTITLVIACNNYAVSSQSVSQFVVVYNPNGGFVTGSGWINSPPGAYVANPGLVGKANFGFVSQYQKGATIPTGQTQFQFQMANFNFQSTAYQWLVISGAKAQYKGTGSLNGGGSYSFLLTAVDGDLIGTTDKFRIKIWNTGGVVYDNQLGDSDSATPTTAIAGGSIVIHK